MQDNSSRKCEYSKLIIPNEPDYARIAGSYSVAIARKVGFDEPSSVEIGNSVTQAIELSMKYSFESTQRSEIDISFERVAEGLKISIHEKGLPLDPSEFESEASCSRVVGDQDGVERFFCINNFMDSFEFRNLGTQGKETVILKKLPSMGVGDYINGCNLEFYQSNVIAPDPKRSPNFVVRRMKEEEAIEVARAVYRAYGYSYGYEQVYYPQKLAGLNRSDEIVTAVAVDESGVVVGTLSLLCWDDNSQVAEIGQGVVIPSYRELGVFSRLVDFQRDEAVKLGLKGFFGLAVTNHMYSQKTASRFGGLDCAIILNYIPATVDFKGFDRSWSGRITVVACYKDLSNPGPISIYPPKNHAPFIEEIYNHLGRPFISKHDTDEPSLQQFNSRVKVLPALKYARITVNGYGANFIQYLKPTVRELLFSGVEIINVFIDLSNPATPLMAPEIEKLGFFFGGVLPNAAMGDDALVFQYLKGTPINYGEIQLASSFGRKILEYIRLNDPNWQ
jgi:serine/threonine-protein kinase RsbW